MTDLVAFLRARLDEDERVALAVPEARRVWHVDGGSVIAGHPTDEVVDWVYDEGAADHIVRHDPARVLREVEAKREIIDYCESVMDDGTSGADLARFTLRRLALPSDHPDYRSEWAVTP